MYVQTKDMTGVKQWADSFTRPVIHQPSNIILQTSLSVHFIPVPCHIDGQK